MIAPVIAAVETASVSPAVTRELAVHGAGGSHESSTFTLVRVITSDGVSGFGEVSAMPRWSGEDHVTAAHYIRRYISPALIGQPLNSVPALTREIDRVVAGNPFTKAGVNMALWDALGRRSGLRVVDFLGGPFREAIPVKMSLSGDGDRLVACYNEVRRRGFTSFKVKVGLGVHGDVARFILAREIAGPDTYIGADANGGWSRIEAATAIPRLRDLGAAFIEQPVQRNDVEGLRELRGQGLPVVADEAVFTLADAARIVRAEAADVVSVYVGKSGALENAVLAVQMLALFGVEAVIGSNGELGLGAAAQLHVACACPRLSGIPSDIIGHHYYDSDILSSPLRIDGVHAHLPDGPGLGVELAPEFLDGFS